MASTTHISTSMISTYINYEVQKSMNFKNDTLMTKSKVKSEYINTLER